MAEGGLASLWSYDLDPRYHPEDAESLDAQRIACSPEEINSVPSLTTAPVAETAEQRHRARLKIKQRRINQNAVQLLIGLGRACIRKQTKLQDEQAVNAELIQTVADLARSRAQLTKEVEALKERLNGLENAGGIPAPSTTDDQCPGGGVAARPGSSLPSAGASPQGLRTLSSSGKSGPVAPATSPTDGVSPQGKGELGRSSNAITELSQECSPRYLLEGNTQAGDCNTRGSAAAVDPAAAGTAQDSDVKSTACAAPSADVTNIDEVAKERDADTERGAVQDGCMVEEWNKRTGAFVPILKVGGKMPPTGSRLLVAMAEVTHIREASLATKFAKAISNVPHNPHTHDMATAADGSGEGRSPRSRPRPRPRPRPQPQPQERMKVAEARAQAEPKAATAMRQTPIPTPPGDGSGDCDGDGGGSGGEKPDVRMAAASPGVTQTLMQSSGPATAPKAVEMWQGPGFVKPGSGPRVGPRLGPGSESGVERVRKGAAEERRAPAPRILADKTKAIAAVLAASATQALVAPEGSKDGVNPRVAEGRGTASTGTSGGRSRAERGSSPLPRSWSGVLSESGVEGDAGESDIGEVGDGDCDGGTGGDDGDGGVISSGSSGSSGSNEHESVLRFESVVATKKGDARCVVRHMHVLQCHLCGQYPRSATDGRSVVFCSRCPRKACLSCLDSRVSKNRTDWSPGRDTFSRFFEIPRCQECVKGTDDKVPPWVKPAWIQGEEGEIEISEAEIMSMMSNFLDWLEDHDLTHFFADEVDSGEYPQYREMVKNPMNFTRMRKRLEKGEYGSRRAGPNLFMEDIDWIRHNCILFNGEHAAISRSAVILSQRAEKYYSTHITPIFNILRRPGAEGAHRPPMFQSRKRRQDDRDQSGTAVTMKRQRPRLTLVNERLMILPAVEAGDDDNHMHQPYAATSEEDSTGLKRSKCEEPILSSEDMAGDAEAEWKENEDGDTSYVDVSDDELDSSDGIVDDDGCSTLQKRLLCTSDGYDSSPSRKASAMATVMAATVTATATGTATGTAAITQDQVSDSQPERGQHREEEGHFVEGWFDALEEQPLNSTIGSSNIRPGATLELEIERALAAEEEGEMRWRGMAGGNSGRGVEGKTGGLDMDLNTGVDARREMADALKLMGGLICETR